MELEPAKILHARIEEIRRLHGLEDSKLHFNEMTGRKWYRRDEGTLQILRIAIESLRSKGSTRFSTALCCKIAVLFYPAALDHRIFSGPSTEQKTRLEETVLRIALKGAAHYLYDEEHPVEITRLVSDGQTHHREFCTGRLFEQLRFEEDAGRSALRDHVTIPAEAEVVHLPSHHREHRPDSDESRWATLLQLADLLLGGITQSAFKNGGPPPALLPRERERLPCSKKELLSAPVHDLLAKRERGAGFRHSGHFGSFSVSRIELDRERRMGFREVGPARQTGTQSGRFDWLEGQEAP